MKYISLFSGIGGFEIAIHNIFSDAECIGYSEIDKFAIQVYSHHFPTHMNLGDITKLEKEHIQSIVQKAGGCDLIVGGFPCQNLSCVGRPHKNCNTDGLYGPKSGLFWDMLRVIDWIQSANPKEVKLNILIENNASMSNINKKLITDNLQSLFNYPIWMTKLNGADFGVQTRRRLYWTTWEVGSLPIECTQTWNDVLLPLEECTDYVSHNTIINTGNKKYPSSTNNYCYLTSTKNNRWKFNHSSINMVSKWQKKYHSDNQNDKATPFIRGRKFDNFLLDRREGDGNIIVRHFDTAEIERLFFIPNGWVGNLCSKTRSSMLLGNTVITRVIEYILTDYSNAKKPP